MRAQMLKSKMQNAGIAMLEEEIVLPVLAGLPPQYDMFVTVVEQDNNLTLTELRAKLMLAEQRLTREPLSYPDSERALTTTVS